MRRDVTVAVTSLLNTDWYPRGLVRRPIEAYDAARGPAVYRNRSWPLPAQPILTMSTAQLDAIPQYVEVHEPQLFQHGGIRAVVDPRRLEYGVPIRSDLIVLELLQGEPRHSAAVHLPHHGRLRAGAGARAVRARAGAGDARSRAPRSHRTPIPSRSAASVTSISRARSRCGRTSARRRRSSRVAIGWIVRPSASRRRMSVRRCSSAKRSSVMASPRRRSAFVAKEWTSPRPRARWISSSRAGRHRRRCGAMLRKAHRFP